MALGQSPQPACRYGEKDCGAIDLGKGNRMTPLLGGEISLLIHPPSLLFAEALLLAKASIH